MLVMLLLHRRFNPAVTSSHLLPIGMRVYILPWNTSFTEARAYQVMIAHIYHSLVSSLLLLHHLPHSLFLYLFHSY
jgi:hypothetical protein